MAAYQRRASLILTPALLLLVLLALPLYGKTQELNGFVLDNSIIPSDSIMQGGPPRDGIPSIDKPAFLAGKEVSYIAPDDRVVGVYRSGIAKAYPISILNWHEIVNDQFNGEHVVISYCPLCGTAMVFSSEASGVKTFGVSGLLYNSDVLMYDRETESLWSQILQRAVSGPMVGVKLRLLSAYHTSWREWSRRYPQTLVLSRKTGFRRDYGRDPYEGYSRQRTLYFPVGSQNSQYHPKEQVLGIHFNGVTKAYPFVELAKQGQSRFKDTIAGTEVIVEWLEKERTARVLTSISSQKQEEALPAVIAYWFAWFAFYPETDVFRVP